MLHYTCDMCSKPMFPGHDVRYEVIVEVKAAVDSVDISEADLEADHLEGISEALESAEKMSAEELQNQVYRKITYDLCAGCRSKFMQDPLTRKPSPHPRFNLFEN